MQIFLEKDRLLFTGNVRQLREFLRRLPDNKMTLREYITLRLH